MLQSVSHEVAVRAIEEKPQQARDVLDVRKEAYMVEVAAIRDEITERYMQAKVADKERRLQAKQVVGQDQAVPKVSNLPGLAEPFPALTATRTGNGNTATRAGQ